mmetsp:Transcript_24724/g.98147  ORF Transcript_24724/g.98147 Transcript_24724/m.98147 type:complete len:335 (+) Transcript_24724:1449-2453(+)
MTARIASAEVASQTSMPGSTATWRTTPSSTTKAKRCVRTPTPKPMSSLSPSLSARSPSPSARNRIALLGTPMHVPSVAFQALRTNRSLVDVHAIVSTPASRNLPASLTNPGTWTSEHVGVNAPGSPKRTVVPVPGPKSSVVDTAASTAGGGVGASDVTTAPSSPATVCSASASGGGSAAKLAATSSTSTAGIASPTWMGCTTTSFFRRSRPSALLTPKAIIVGAGRAARSGRLVVRGRCAGARPAAGAARTTTTPRPTRTQRRPHRTKLLLPRAPTAPRQPSRRATRRTSSSSATPASASRSSCERRQPSRRGRSTSVGSPSSPPTHCIEVPTV